MDNTEEEADVDNARKDTRLAADVEAFGAGNDAGTRHEFGCWNCARLGCNTQPAADVEAAVARNDAGTRHEFGCWDGVRFRCALSSGT